MREIKFRAWGKESGMMFHVGEIHFCNGGIKVYGQGIHIDNGWATNANGFKHRCDVALMQYTGLKDCNGVEIYEGDIVEILGSEDFEGSSQWLDDDPRWENPPRKPSTFDVVEINPPRFWLKNETFGYEGEKLIQPYNCKVIGNIHENPELLESD